jgi:hypothetical protein
MGKRLSIIKDMVRFLWKEKMWWLIPAIVVLVVLGILLVVLESSPLGFLIYPFL